MPDKSCECEQLQANAGEEAEGRTGEGAGGRTGAGAEGGGEREGKIKQSCRKKEKHLLRHTPPCSWYLISGNYYRRMGKRGKERRSSRVAKCGQEIRGKGTNHFQKRVSIYVFKK